MVPGHRQVRTLTPFLCEVFTISIEGDGSSRNVYDHRQCTGMDHSTNHPKFSHDTLIRTLRYLAGTYYMTRYLIYYKGFMISYKMRPWRQIRVSLKEVTVPTQRTTHKREFCHIRHILVTSLEAGSGFLLRTLKLVPPESDNAAKPCISPLVGTVLFLGRGGFSLASRVIF